MSLFSAFYLLLAVEISCSIKLSKKNLYNLGASVLTRTFQGPLTGWVVTWFLLGYTVRMFEYTVRTF